MKSIFTAVRLAASQALTGAALHGFVLQAQETPKGTRTMKGSKTQLATITIIFLIFLGGCASVGKEFNYQNLSSLELGKTSSSDYVSMFGDPTNVEVKQTSDGKFELVGFVYAHANVGTAKVRELNLEFRDGLLNSYAYASSFKEDQTLVDLDRLSEIERGTTLKGDVVILLGEPDGKARCPSESAWSEGKCSFGTEMWIWHGMNRLSTFGSTFGRAQLSTKNAFVIFDDAGVVVELGSEATN